MSSTTNRSYRLNLLQCFLDKSPVLTHTDNLSREYSKETIALVQSWNNAHDVISGLFYQDVVSTYYSKKCLDVDLWYLTRKINFTPGSFHEESSLETDEGKILFRVIVQSLTDLYIGRPCDMDCWKIDDSPDFQRCTESCHICWQDSENYLLNLDSEAEDCIGLSDGHLEHLVKTIKKDGIFLIPSLIPD